MSLGSLINFALRDSGIASDRYDVDLQPSSSTISSVAAARVAAERARAAAAASVADSAGAAGASSDCLICGGALSFIAVLPCGHSDLCVMCVARVRLLSGNRRCPLCKADSEHLVAISAEEAVARGAAGVAYSDFGIFGDQCGPSLVLDYPSGIFFHDSARSELTALERIRSFKCGAALDGGKRTCEAVPSDLEALIKHGSSAHGLHICELCAKHRAVFVNELPRFSAKRLREHCEQGDPSAGFNGHPLCQFCNSRFYDDGALYTHLKRDHFSCHLCAAADPPTAHAYFNAYADLASHFSKRHYACRHESCKTARYIAFATPLDLSAHLAGVHGETTNVLPHVAFKFKTSGGVSPRGGNRNASRGRGNGSERTAADGDVSSEDDIPAESGGRITRINFEARDFPSLASIGMLGNGASPSSSFGGASASSASSASAPPPAVSSRSGPFSRALAPNAPRGVIDTSAFPALPAVSMASTVSQTVPGRGGRGAGNGMARPRLSAYTSLSALLVMTGQSHLAESNGSTQALSLSSFDTGASESFAAVQAAASRPSFQAQAKKAAAAPAAAAPTPAVQQQPSAANSSSALAALTSALTPLPVGLDTFRALSAEFRGGALSARDYHASIVLIFKDADAAASSLGLSAPLPLSIFSRYMRVLLEALPDLGQRAAACEVHDSWVAAHRTSFAAANDAPTATAANAQQKSNWGPVPQRRSAASSFAGVASQAVATSGPPPLSGTILADGSGDAFPRLPVAPVPIGALLNRVASAGALETTFTAGGARSMAADVSRGKGGKKGSRAPSQPEPTGDDWDFAAHDGSFRVTLPRPTPERKSESSSSTQPPPVPTMSSKIKSAPQEPSTPRPPSAAVVPQAIISAATAPPAVTADGWISQLAPRVAAPPAPPVARPRVAFPSTRSRLGPDRPLYRSEADLDRILSGVVVAASSSRATVEDVLGDKPADEDDDLAALRGQSKQQKKGRK